MSKNIYSLRTLRTLRLPANLCGGVRNSLDRIDPAMRGARQLDLRFTTTGMDIQDIKKSFCLRLSAYVCGKNLFK